MPLQIITDKTIPGYDVDGNRKQWTSNDGDTIEINANRKLSLPGWKFGPRMTFTTTGRRVGTTFHNLLITDFESPEGLRLENCSMATIEKGVVIKQRLGPLPELRTVGIDIDSNTSANAPTIRDVDVSGFDVGVLLGGDIEGGLLDNVRLVGNNRSVIIKYGQLEPGFQIIGGHSNSANEALSMDGAHDMLAQIFIDRWLVYYNRERFTYTAGYHASVNKPNKYRPVVIPHVYYETPGATVGNGWLTNVVRYSLIGVREEPWHVRWYIAERAEAEARRPK